MPARCQTPPTADSLQTPGDLLRVQVHADNTVALQNYRIVHVRRPTPYQVRDIGERLMGQLGGVPSLPAIVSAVRSETGCSRATAYRAVRDR